MTAMKIGIIGTGAIAPAYMQGTKEFPADIQVVACADLATEKAQAFAEKYGITALSIEALLADPEIDIVINLTIPAAHAEVNQQVLAAGKHVYSEKPLSNRLAEAQAVMKLAQEKGLRVGCAPDTFLGSGGQTARRAIDEGLIGRPISATAFMQSPGVDHWHPNPFFYYTEGGGPMLDMGPYYLTTLVNLLGSVQTVAAMARIGFENRIAGHEGVRGRPIPVTVNTHSTGVVGFASGVIATVITSFDVWQHHLPRIEIHGTAGSLSVPDPNIFGGTVELWTPQTREWQPIPSQHREDVQRGIGVADMARAIRSGEPHRASGELALHVLETMLAFDQSSQQAAFVQIQHQAQQPAVLPPNK